MPATVVGFNTLCTVVANRADIKYILHNITHFIPEGVCRGATMAPTFRQSHDVIGGEPIAISGTNSRLRADTEQKNPNITLPDPGFEPRTSERCRTAHALQLRHRGSPTTNQYCKHYKQVSAHQSINILFNYN
ncbi:hypothetical protein O3G_MSEX013554 [Manduca sexta]|uniref:Uncharacterized protein n=1 Tax=Manduca sexta TaxID=7130 RepID=A0A922CZG3_MANSE|nr:hypothetical protein O3G_MSEX013554 [Manduca sexta]